MKWFQHSASSRQDVKIRNLIHEHGAPGYAVYWYCLESICSGLEKNLTFELEEDSKLIARDLKLDTFEVEKIMLYLVNTNLFEQDGDRIYCLKLARYLGDNLTRNQALKEIIRGEKEAAKNEKSPRLSQTVSDCMSLSQQEERRGEEKTGDNNNTSSPVGDSPSESVEEPPDADPIPVKEIVSLYHQILPDLPACQKITPKRRGWIQQRWREDMPDLDTWEGYFHWVGQSDFLMGRSNPGPGRRIFRATLEWITNQSNYAKIIEGNYHGQVGFKEYDDQGRLSGAEQTRAARHEARLRQAEPGDPS